MQNYNIAIIGSGIIGMTLALQLSSIEHINITLYGKKPKYSQFKNYLPNMEVPDLKIKYWRFFS